MPSFFEDLVKLPVLIASALGAVLAVLITPRRMVMPFTLLLGHAFEETAMTDAPALLRDADHSPESEKLVERLRANKTFAWQDWPADSKQGDVDLLRQPDFVVHPRLFQHQPRAFVKSRQKQAP